MTESTAERVYSACLIIIGDEILSGRTQDANLSYLAKWLNDLGIQLREARVVPDVEAEIVAAVNACRARHDYVFTTGGIGPTHDDITAESVARAFDVALEFHPDAWRALQAHYGAENFNPSRQRMARVPAGGLLIDNPLSKAPGFQIGNVFVMAGIPKVMQTMLESLRHRLVGGRPVVSVTVQVAAGESLIAATLGDVQAEFSDVSLGSYPSFRDGQPLVGLVLRGTDPKRLAQAETRLRQALADAGHAPLTGDATA